MLLFDGTNHPGAATVIADGLDGAALYVGTPTSVKDATAAQYADYKSHHLATLLVYEHTTNDISGGATSGAAHARAFLADAHAKAMSVADPACAAVDEHVTAANLPLAVAYLRGFRAALIEGGWIGPIGVYGFPEALKACHDAGIADWYWGAGRRADQPSYTNVWQDNTGTIQVGGATDDKDWVLIPLPTTTEEPVAVTDADVADIWGYQNTSSTSNDPHDMHQALKNAEANSAAAVSAIGALKAQIQGAITSEQAAILAAIANADTDVKSGAAQVLAALASAGGIDVGQLASALAPLLNSSEAAEFMDALRAQLAK